VTSERVAGATWRLLYRAIVGPSKRPAALRRPDSEDGSVTGMVRELEAHYGSPKAAAQASNVPRSTWGFWKVGTRRPKADRIDALRRVQRRSRVTAIRERWMRSEESQIGLHLHFRVSRDTRERKIIITGWRESATVRGMRDDILDAFFAMDGSRAVEVIENALSSGVNGDSEIEDIHDIRWFKTRAEALLWQRII
jgi:hypothetical protein